MRKYLVGGYVRDEILGVPSKDMDYTVVLEPQDFYIRDGAFSRDPFMVMVTHLESMGFKIFLETREFLTVRAQFPKIGDAVQTPDAVKAMGFGDTGTLRKSERAGVTADFVLARKESNYTDGRRPDKVEIGTLEDDLARRDFTMNAIAKDEAGNYIDPYDGIGDIERQVIRAVGNPMERLTEDALRAVRALRFMVTKGFDIAPSLAAAMQSPQVLKALENNIAVERIDEELRKAFRHDTLRTLYALEDFSALRAVLFSGRLSLEPTLKTRGRNK